MPNHFHGILSIDSSVETSPTPKLGDVIRSFKSITTNRYTTGVRDLNWAPFDRRIWQRNYYEHIIRNDRSLETIQNYINNNPANWERDELHPDVQWKYRSTIVYLRRFLRRAACCCLRLALFLPTFCLIFSSGFSCSRLNSRSILFMKSRRSSRILVGTFAAFFKTRPFLNS